VPSAGGEGAGAAGFPTCATKAWFDLAEGREEEAAAAFEELAERWTSKWAAAWCQLEAARPKKDRDGFAAAIEAFEKMGAKRAAPARAST
jgi:hypothetical protein